MTPRPSPTQACPKEGHDQPLHGLVFSHSLSTKIYIICVLVVKECVHMRPCRTTRFIVHRSVPARTESGLVRTTNSRLIVATRRRIGHTSRGESGNLQPNSAIAEESMRTGIHSHPFAVEVILAPMRSTESHHHSTQYIAMKDICFYSERYSKRETL